ncbi:MAG: GspH/FimT family pseudopilin [Gammaproteobacteria bacterium]|jgi:type IV fimbrial biogenesis protein FimT
MQHNKSTMAGFTLIELMVTIALAAIILTQAVPSFNALVQNNRLISQKNEFISTLNLARSEALKRGTRVTVCASTDQTTCDTNDWAQGWIVFSDRDADQVLDSGTGACLATEDCLIRVSTGLSDGNSLSAKKTGAAAVAGFIQYTPRGAVDAATTFTFCDKRGDSHARATNINNLGRAISASDSGADGIVNDVDGNNVSCAS